LTSLAVSCAVQSRLPRFGSALLVTAGVAPDLDYASYFVGPSALLTLHRTALHSIGGAAITSCALAVLFCTLDKKWPPRKPTKNQAAALTFAPALAICAVGAIGHQLLDLASGEGIQLLWPFRTHWSRWNLTSTFDPWILLVLVGALLIPQLFRLVSEEVGGRTKGTAGSGAALAAILLLVTYFGARAYLRGRAIEILLTSEYHGREPASAGAFPLSSNPFTWRGVVSTDETLEEIDINLSPGASLHPDRSLTHYKPADSAALQTGEKTNAAQQFLKYAQFPLASVARREDTYRFELRDLSFPADDDSPANLIIRVDLSSNAQIIREEIRYASSAGN
jgi:membrane-bound metal-dependent hydrolase YbcI (DUF457 family)